MPERLAICRYDLPQLIAQRGYRIGCEVGVEHGHFSFYLLRHSALSILHSVDPYTGKWGKLRADAESLLSEFGPRSQLHVKTSFQAATEFAGNGQRFDFVYLDGDHKGKSVRDDIAAWWPLINHGGLLSGHDFHSVYGPGVVWAVMEFVEREGLPLQLTREPWATWMVYKP